jgi:AraC-like DNA-binding protein
MLLFLSMLGIFLSAILLFFNARENRLTLFLGLFFLFLSLYSLYQYILLYSKSVFLISLFLFNIAIVSSPLYLIGPMLYWYIRSVLTDNAKLTRRDFWHLVPMIIFFIAALPHAFVPWHEKVEAARTVVADAGFMGEYRATLLAKIFSPTLEYLTRPVLVLGYTLWSAGLFFNYLIRKESSLVLSKQHFMTKWLFLLLGFLLILEVSQMLLIIRAFKMDFSYLYFHINLLRILSSFGLTGLLITPFFFPSILYGLPRLPYSLTDTRKEENPEKLIPENIKKQLHLENNYLDSLGQQVDVYMEKFKPYLQPELNLSQVSFHLGVPTHHLGYYFKEVKKQPFHDYRNKWRIKHAKKLIREGKNNEITLEAIGTLSGFTNRNAFRAAFQKLEGTSPAAYTKKITE